MSHGHVINSGTILPDNFHFRLFLFLNFEDWLSFGQITAS